MHPVEGSVVRATRADSRATGSGLRDLPRSEFPEGLCSTEGLRARKRPLPKERPIPKTLVSLGFSLSAGGGTRTPDTRIMIPLL
jgi:hypothetical protein